MVSVLAIHKVQHFPTLLALDLGGSYPIPDPLYHDYISWPHRWR